jgi:thioredoxin 1
MESENITDMEISQEEFNKIINNSHKLVVVDFFAEWCMPCLMQSPIIEDIALQLKDVKFIKINKEDNPELASKYGVSTIPCLLVFKDGKEAERIIGTHSAEIIERKIKGCLG